MIYLHEFVVQTYILQNNLIVVVLWVTHTHTHTHTHTRTGILFLLKEGKGEKG